MVAYFSENLFWEFACQSVGTLDNYTIVTQVFTGVPYIEVVITNDSETEIYIKYNS